MATLMVRIPIAAAGSNIARLRVLDHHIRSGCAASRGKRRGAGATISGWGFLWSASIDAAHLLGEMRDVEVLKVSLIVRRTSKSSAHHDTPQPRVADREEQPSRGRTKQISSKIGSLRRA